MDSMMTIKHSADHEEALFQVIASLETAEEVRRFMTDLCTRKEISEFAERWEIAKMLHTGTMSYRDISAATGASTTTVGRVAKFLAQEPHQGYKLVLDRTATK